MVLPERSSRQSLIPAFLYSPSPAVIGARSLGIEGLLSRSHGAAPSSGSLSSPLPSHEGPSRPFLVPAPKEKIELYSPQFYAACTAGGIASCGLTHMAVTPLDLVKCNMQVGVGKFW